VRAQLLEVIRLRLPLDQRDGESSARKQDRCSATGDPAADHRDIEFIRRQDRRF
jgi:hypothetical protein